MLRKMFQEERRREMKKNLRSLKNYDSITVF